jgi:hypothetical protein
LIQTVLIRLLRLVMFAAGLVLAVGVLLFGLVLATGLLLWSLMRGRRPAFVLRTPLRGTFQRMRPGQTGGFGMPPRQTRQAQANSEVIDVEVREVPESRRAVPPPGTTPD